MPRPRFLAPFAVLVATSALVAGCSSSSKSSSIAAGSGSAAPSASAAPTTAAGSAGAASPTVKLATTSLGQVVVDDTGMTLYLFTQDSGGKSTCTGGCATLWPALTVSGSPSAGTGVDAAKLGRITRPDGTTQVTYGGAPLYHFAKDSAPGDVKGENVGSVWFAVQADGSKAAPPATAGY